MRLTLLTDYALRTLMFAARCRRRFTAAEVAGFFTISEDHVVKAVHLLAKAGLLRSVRGRGGGLEQSRPFDEITVGEVVEACEGPLRLLDCVGTPGVCVIQHGCRLRTVLADAGDKMMEHLRGVTIAEVVRGSPALKIPV